MGLLWPMGQLNMLVRKQQQHWRSCAAAFLSEMVFLNSASPNSLFK